MIATLVLQTAYPALGAANSTDLVFWTTDTLYAYMDEALKRLARTAGLFAEEYTAASSSDVVSLPGEALAVVHVSVYGRSLRPTTVAELQARDPEWEFTTGVPSRWTQDLGLGRARLYPAASPAVVPVLILRTRPDAIASAISVIEAPAALAAYLRWGVVAQARSGMGEAAALDVADWCEAQMKMFEQACVAFWGSAT